jgi:hypothetical protein
VPPLRSRLPDDSHRTISLSSASVGEGERGSAARPARQSSRSCSSSTSTPAPREHLSRHRRVEQRRRWISSTVSRPVAARRRGGEGDGMPRCRSRRCRPCR